MSILSKYRYLSARTVLSLSKLKRCQSLPTDTWGEESQFWSIIFISHRWASQDDPDPTGSQLHALQTLARSVTGIASIVLEDQSTHRMDFNGRVNQYSLGLHGNLQAAHLIFRTLCFYAKNSNNFSELKDIDQILDVIGFWYDYSCLPQDPMTNMQKDEFNSALKGVQKLISHPRVTTLILRKSDDGFLGRGWCVAESAIAYSKNDTSLPLVLYTSELKKPFSTLNKLIENAFKEWERISDQESAWQGFCMVINATSEPMILKRDFENSEIFLAHSDALDIGHRLLTAFLVKTAIMNDGDCLDLFDHFPEALKRENLGCRDKKDYALVSLMIINSVVATEASQNLSIWREALTRCVDDNSLVLTKENNMLIWQM